VKFKECSPGVFFPEQEVGRSYNHGTEHTSSTTEVSDLRVNEPLPKDIFRLTYPRGVILSDTIRGTQYRVDSQGNMMSKETPMGREAPPPDQTRTESEWATETQEEPRSAVRWILPVSFGIVTVAGVAAFVQRRRTKRGRQ
jgi:hypothetical protein